MNCIIKSAKAYCVWILFVLTTFLLTPLSFASVTVWHYPQSDSIAAGSSWENPNNALTCNSVSAYYMGLDTNDSLFTSNYGFSLPTGVIIDSLWYKYTGLGSGDGEEATIRIGFIAGSNRDAGASFYLTSMARADSARLLNFDPNIITVSCANSAAFGLYVVTSGDEYLTDTYIDCLAIKIFYHESTSSLRRQRIIRMENDR
jgi:hypothetical protein